MLSFLSDKSGLFAGGFQASSTWKCGLEDCPDADSDRSLWELSRGMGNDTYFLREPKTGLWSVPDPDRIEADYRSIKDVKGSDKLYSLWIKDRITFSYP